MGNQCGREKEVDRSEGGSPKKENIDVRRWRERVTVGRKEKTSLM
jgi:hypothetical protein